MWKLDFERARTALARSQTLFGKGFVSQAALDDAREASAIALLALGLTKTEAKSCIRFSLGESNSEEEVDALIAAVAAAVTHLRKLSPTYV